MNATLFTGKPQSLVVALVLLGGLTFIPPAVQAHSVSACIEDIADHCWTWYENEPIALNICIAELIGQCAAHSHGGSHPGPDAEDFTTELNETAAKYRALREQMIKLRVRQTIRRSTAPKSEKGYKDVPTASPDLILKWTPRPGQQGRRITKLTRCIDKKCDDVDFGGLVITARDEGPQADTVEVCHPLNPFIDRCDVYDCFEDHEAQQSVCEFITTYNKNCLSETCES